MTDEAWERLRQRTILVAFQTGRPVFADSDGALRFADGEREPVPDDVGAPKTDLPKATPSRRTLWSRLFRGKP